MKLISSALRLAIVVTGLAAACGHPPETLLYAASSNCAVVDDGDAFFIATSKANATAIAAPNAEFIGVPSQGTLETGDLDAGTYRLEGIVPTANGNVHRSCEVKTNGPTGTISCSDDDAGFSCFVGLLLED